MEGQGKLFAGEFGAVRDGTIAERAEAGDPHVAGVAGRFHGSRLPDALAGQAIIREHRQLGGALLVVFLGEGDFRNLRRLPRHKRGHGHLRHANQERMPIGADTARSRLNHVRRLGAIFLQNAGAGQKLLP